MRRVTGVILRTEKTLRVKVGHFLGTILMSVTAIVATDLVQSLLQSLPPAQAVGGTLSLTRAPALFRASCWASFRRPADFFKGQRASF